jgi:hypothetical protein
MPPKKATYKHAGYKMAINICMTAYVRSDFRKMLYGLSDDISLLAPDERAVIVPLAVLGIKIGSNFPNFLYLREMQYNAS